MRYCRRYLGYHGVDGGCRCCLCYSRGCTRHYFLGPWGKRVVLKGEAEFVEDGVGDVNEPVSIVAGRRW